jgi:hypothetical protein
MFSWGFLFYVVLSSPPGCSWLTDVGGREKLVHEKTPAGSYSFHRLFREHREVRMAEAIVLPPWRGLTVTVVTASGAVGSDRRSLSKLLTT